MSEHTCEVRGNCLVMSGDFSKDTETDFDDACQKLLSWNEPDLAVDLTGMTRICSTYVGLLAELCLGAQGRGKKLVIRAGTKIAAALRDAGLDHAATVEEVA
ncbi:MAG: STAS domain-containing protein [Planctomycetota bacterium]|jgi:ABC-type transporter Mla MlaB component